jgi:CRP/FNR family cyclic AMP-dependent transcriptional regulator
MININLLLATGAVYKKISPGSIIFLEGESCNFYYQLVSGKVKWANINDEGKEYLQAMVAPGECFGDLPLFDEGPYAASAVAVEESLIIRLRKDMFHHMLEEHPDINRKFTKLLAQRLRFKFFLLKELLSKEPHERVSSLLGYLKENHHNCCSDCGKINLTRQEIANMTCLRVETVIRTLRKMHIRGDISIVKGKVFCGEMTPVIPVKCVA